MLVVVVVACEVGFWVLLVAGLVARYGLRMQRLSVVLLASVPLVDLVLLVVSVLDLRRGGTATAAHGLAAGYIAFSVVFGHRTIRAIDARVAHRWAAGPAPHRAPRRGPEAVRVAWASWGRAVLAWAISVGLLVTAIVTIGDSTRTSALADWAWALTAGVLVWLLTGPVATLTLRRRLL